VSPTVTTQYICALSDGSSTLTDTAEVAVHSEPTAFAGDDEYFPNTVITFPASGQATEYSSVKWTTVGDGTFDTATILTPVYSTGWQEKQAGYFTLTLTAKPIPTCATTASDDITITFSPSVGMDNISSGSFSISLFPNPAQNSCMLTISNLTDLQADISMTDMSGRQIWSDKLSGPQKSAIKYLDLGKTAKGVYFIKVKTVSGTKTEKLIVQ
jgi:hypothetical protein